jgi:hypothetical protein
VTIAFEPLISETPAVGSKAILELARIESFRMLRRASIWIGFALSVALAVTYARGQQDWSSQKYQSLVPLSVYPMTMGVYVAGVRSGNRDQSHRRPPLAEEAPLNGDARAWARLASLCVPVAMTALLMTVIGVASRIEGGYQLGEWQDWTNSAVHSVFELMQPALSIAVVGAAAVAIGRGVRRSGPAIVVGMVLLFFTGGVYWLWNDDAVYTTALIQVQPMEFADRVAVHIPTVAFHDLYLLGLVALFCGLSLRSRPRARLVAAGAAVAVAAVAAQLVVSPL